MPPLRITAHSGCLGTPPNSLPYLDAALALRMSFVEVDVRLSPRGDLVLSHDPVSRHRTQLLTLASVWNRVHDDGASFNLDVKEAEALEPLARFLKSREGQIGTPLVTGCDGVWASKWVSFQTGIPVLYNVLTGPLEEESLEAWEVRTVAEALASGASGLNANFRLVTKGLATLAVQSGMTLDVWTVNESSDLEHCLNLGVHGITTDRPDRVHTLLTRFWPVFHAGFGK